MKHVTLLTALLMNSFFFSSTILYGAEKKPHSSTPTLVTLLNKNSQISKQTTPLIAVLCCKQPGWSIEDSTIEWSFDVALDIAKSEDSIKYVDHEGCTALSIVCWNGQEYECAKLLEEGAQVCPEDKRTPCVLTQALFLSQGQWNNILNMLVQYAPDSCFSNLNSLGYSPLAAAALACAGSDDQISAITKLCTKKKFCLADFQKKGSNTSSACDIINLGKNEPLKLWWGKTLQEFTK